ncbi:MAG: hypothetical protein JXA16_00795 [Bacteroidales bacterium]|nr:hypothetical protein [Bacteroidales bacterium]
MRNRIIISMCFINIVVFLNCSAPKKFTYNDIQSIHNYSIEKDVYFFFSSMMYPFHFRSANKLAFDQPTWRILNEDSSYIYFGYEFKISGNLQSNGVFKTDRLILSNAFPNYKLIDADKFISDFLKFSKTCKRENAKCGTGELYYDFTLFPDILIISYKEKCRDNLFKNINNIYTIYNVGIDINTFECKCLKNN